MTPFHISLNLSLHSIYNPWRYFICTLSIKEQKQPLTMASLPFLLPFPFFPPTSSALEPWLTNGKIYKNSFQKNCSSVAVVVVFGWSRNNDPTQDGQGQKQPPTIPTRRTRVAADETALWARPQGQAPLSSPHPVKSPLGFDLESYLVFRCSGCTLADRRFQPLLESLELVSFDIIHICLPPLKCKLCLVLLFRVHLSGSPPSWELQIMPLGS